MKTTNRVTIIFNRDNVLEFTFENATESQNFAHYAAKAKEVERVMVNTVYEK